MYAICCKKTGDRYISVIYTPYIINCNILIHVDEYVKPGNETFSRAVDVVELEQNIYITRVVK